MWTTPESEVLLNIWPVDQKFVRANENLFIPIGRRENEGDSLIFFDFPTADLDILTRCSGKATIWRVEPHKLLDGCGDTRGRDDV